MKKFISWNVNGLRAVLKKNFREIFLTLDADAFGIQETKMQEGQADVSFAGYHDYWNYAERKGYSGTALFVKEEPLSASCGIGIPEHDREGRVITLEFPGYYLLTVYTPNSGEGLKRLSYRQEWDAAFLEYVRRLDQRKPVIWCGDLNVAHEPIDIKNPDSNHHNAGYTDEERRDFTEMLRSGFLDTYRTLYPDRVEYSWWSYRFHARESNAGWRIDYFVVSERLRDKVKDAKILGGFYGSDHCPVELDIDL